MHLIISFFVIIFAGWTLAAHVCVLLGFDLSKLLLAAPIFIISLFGIFVFLLKEKGTFSHHQNIFFSCSGGSRLANHYISIVIYFLLFFSPVFIFFSWNYFLFSSVSLLFLCTLWGDMEEQSHFSVRAASSQKLDLLIIVLLSIALVGLSYVVSRGDLDDAFYVAVSAFLSSNPQQALLAVDPMLGEAGFPLLFNSYRFASFELLSGAVAHLLSVPAMDVYYIYLLPIWVVAAVIANFLLTRELFPEHWLLAGVVALLLTLLLGEMHRSPANFSFVRIFQGKAVFLSVIVPTIFYLTARFFSQLGTKADFFLLACCQVASVGLTNFGMLMGPIVGFGALVSNIPSALRGDRKKFYCALAPLLFTLPYLIDVALGSRISPIMNFEAESSADVWISVFGSHQQYFVCFLILAGPVLAKDRVTRWRLTVPPLLLFAIYLNPWLSGFISKHVTTPPVYWRVVWSFPVLIFAAVSFSMIAVKIFKWKSSRYVLSILFTCTIFLTSYSIPYNTLRFENIGPIEGFAAWKIPGDHLVVAQMALKIDSCGGRVLAPDEIAGVISRFEIHPRLISTRGLYLHLMRPMIGESEYAPRKVLYDFVTGNSSQQVDMVRSALRALDVSVVVLKSNLETASVLDLIVSEGFKLAESARGYSIYARTLL